MVIAIHLDPRLTWFSNIGVLIPLSLALAVWIHVRVSRRMALLWLTTVAAVGILTAVPKIWLDACHLSLWNIHSPSGGVSFSVIAYGGAAVVMAAAARVWQRVLIAGLVSLWLASLVAGIIVNHVHTPQEAVAGLLFGALGVRGFARFYRAETRPSMRWFVPCAVVLVWLAIYPPAHHSLEPLLTRIGRWSAAHAPICGVGDTPVRPIDWALKQY